MTTATKTMPKEIYRYIEHEIINYPRMIDRINELTRKQEKNLHTPYNTLYLDTRIERLSTVVQCIENVIRNLNSLGGPLPRIHRTTILAYKLQPNNGGNCAKDSRESTNCV